MAYSIDDVLTLVKETPAATLDAYGQETFTETTRTIYCKVTSASRTEYFEARQTGLEPEFVFKTNPANYDGERIAEYNGIRYAIYRTYRRDADVIELYASKKVGAL